MSTNSLEELGLSTYTFTQIIERYKSLIKSIYGQDLDVSAGTYDQELIREIAQAQADLTQMISNIWNALNPNYAVESALDRICAYNGISRLPATFSTATIQITGEKGTIINNGIVKDDSGFTWSLPSVVEIDDGGVDPIGTVITIDVDIVCNTLGKIEAGSNTIETIITITSGWQSVTNADSAIAGVNVETDAQLRYRRNNSVAISATTTVDSIYSAIANIVGVEKTKVYENDTNLVDVYGIDPHSVEVVVNASETTELSEEIADTLRLKKSPGCGTFGTTSVDLNSGGITKTFNFTYANEKLIGIALNITAKANYVVATLDTIKSNLVELLDTYQIGQSIDNSDLYDAVLSADPKPYGVTTFIITSLQIQNITDSGSLGNSVTLGYTDVAYTNEANITIVVA